VISQAFILPCHMAGSCFQLAPYAVSRTSLDVNLANGTLDSFVVLADATFQNLYSNV